MSSAKQANWNLGCSLLLTVLLVGGVLFYFRVKNTYNYILQPGQSVEIRVRPRADQLEYSSELILEKKDNQKIKLSGRNVWSEQFSGLYFEVTENKIIQLGNDTELPNNQQDIQLVEDGIVVTYLGEKVFDVTKSKPYTITVTNVDDKPAHFEAQVVNR
ncbi:hypothetical protein SINDD18_01104 [Streptococcus infantis]|uniref:Uncharacterized protein n=1 Tax=Streptococcus infantis TaxID=68892 RepID=A0A139REG8_9STRE|nr:hypothetical protein [Streptococcus infantis]KXU13104.1 hypothetical protein SINDD18_01104 [Streptococcus infantis]